MLTRARAKKKDEHMLTSIFDVDEVNALISILHLQWWLFRLTFAPGLLALQAYQQQRYGVPLNILDDWQNQIDHVPAHSRFESCAFTTKRLRGNLR
jgi:hypothetical protein